MKYFRLDILFIFSCIILSCNTLTSNTLNSEIIFRSITLNIVDSETNEPLRDIPIRVINTTKKYIRFWGLFMPDDEITKEYVYYYNTDESGIVNIPQYVYHVGKSVCLYEQLILINLDSFDNLKNEYEQNEMIYDRTSFSTETGRWVGLYRFRNDYKAGEILSYPRPMSDNIYYLPDREKPYLQRINNGHHMPDLSKNELGYKNFNRDHEEFTIYLEKFTGH